LGLLPELPLLLLPLFPVLLLTLWPRSCAADVPRKQARPKKRWLEGIQAGYGPTQFG